MPTNHKKISKTITLADQQAIIIETGKTAMQAHGAVEVRVGNMNLRATVVAKEETKEMLEFLPLHVEYREKFSGAGKIPGSFFRREGKPSDHEVLVARSADRAIRPLFPAGYSAEVQICIELNSADPEVLPDALVGLAASAALMVSPIPFPTPIATVRVARSAGQLRINPAPSVLEQADIDLIVAASEESIIMVEGEMDEVQEEDMLSAIQFAHEAIKKQCQVQQELAMATGTSKKVQVTTNGQVTTNSHENAEPQEMRETMSKMLYREIYAIIKKSAHSKQERQKMLIEFKQGYIQGLVLLPNAMDEVLANRYFQEATKKAVRDLALNEGTRLDGRKLDEIRPIWIETDYLPAPHGSALFTRGETQALATVTLGDKLAEQLIDQATVSGYKRFMLHYNFPGFATGEIKPNRGPARREIGHGNLAERALKKVLPPEEENPYTIRIESDILASNGSSSMATVCAGSLALMDAGVPIKTAVSGIAMGLITDPTTGKHAILSDILGDEDALGDMDFKVAGTAKGLTACQMDIKVSSLSYQILQEALVQSRAGRLHILATMNTAIDKPRTSYKPHAPGFSIMNIPKDMIGAVIGSGGKVVQEIQRDTGARIDIKEVDAGGTVRFFASDQESIQKAEQMVKAIVAEPVVGEVYQGKIKSILSFGAFVEFMPGKDGLLHISEVKWERVEDLAQVLEIGETIQVKLIEIDPKTGKYRLSRRALLAKPEAVAS
ncbi:MAG: polyribonucleotide nucleotidyltransferase [Bacteroidota bacterium]